MNEQRLDHAKDLMIRALLDELNEEEKGELDELLANDTECADEWRELQETSTFVRTLSRTAQNGPAAFELPPIIQAKPPVSLAAWRSRLVAATVGFAAAATIFAGLLIAGLRIDRSDSGILVRLGSQPPKVERVQNPEGRNDYVSRAELTATAQMIVAATGARLDELDRRQSGLQTELARSLYGALSERQEIQYADLRQRIELTTALSRAGYAVRSDGSVVPQSWKEPRKD